MSTNTKGPLSEYSDPSLEGAEVVPSAGNELSQPIADQESDGGDYKAYNPHSKALGKYQFVPHWHWKDIQAVTGVKTYDEFLNKPEAQENYFSWHTEHNLKPEVERLRQYNKDGYDDGQLAKLAHFKGPGAKGGAEKWLRYHVDDTTENNVSIDKYVGKPAGATSKGLQSFSDPSLEGAEIISEQQPQATPGENAQPAAPTEWSPSPQATIETAPVTGISAGVTGKGEAPKPAPQKEITAESIKKDLADATAFVAQDVLNRQGELPDSYAQNISTIPIHEPGNIIHDITDPHGNPETSAGYLKTRIAELNKEYKTASERAKSSMMNDPGADMNALGSVTAKHFEDIQKMKASVDHIMDLQLANKAYANNNFDAVKLGIEKQKLMGNPKAEEDEIAYNNKKPLDPHAKMNYQLTGLSILQNAKNNVLANGNDAIAAKFDEHSNEIGKRLRKDNPEVFRQENIRQIANEIAKNETGVNTVYGTLFSRPELTITPELIESTAKKLGISKDEIKDIKPEDIPRTAGWGNQAAQGFVNTAAAPLYEFGMRGLAKLGIANQDAVNKRFKPGWEEQSGMGSLFTGEMPEYQHDIHNFKGLTGVMAKGVGDLGGFFASGKAGVGLMKAFGIAKTATSIEKAHKLMNFATAAVPSYNSAYQRSLEVIGDGSADEGKRQLYSIVNGVIGGTVMMIDPKADIARDIMGETRAGQDFVSMIKNKNINELTRTDLKTKLTQVIDETAKHLGLQVAIPVAQTAAGNITDMIVDPDHKHGLMDNTEQAAIHGAIGMFLPSLFAGIHAPANQTTHNKAMLWDVATNSDKYMRQVSDLYKSGDLTKDQAIMSIRNINKAETILKGQVPAVALINGRKLTPQQQQEYLWSSLKSGDLEAQLAKVKESGDKAQIDQVSNMLNAEVKLRTDILNNAGKITPVKKPIRNADIDAEYAKDMKDLRYMDPKAIAQGIVQDAVKENGNKSEENVSLIPDNNTSSNTKTENDETISRGHERQVSSEISETSGRGQETNNGETASVEGGKDQKSGLLEEQQKPTESKTETGGEATKQSPPETVSSSRKRRFVEEDESAPSGEEESKSSVGKKLVPKPDNHYRKVDDAGMDDLVQSGVVRARPKAPGEQGKPDEDGVAINKKQFDKVFFNKGQPHEGYKGDYVVETEGINMAIPKSGHGFGHAPYDESTGQFAKEIPLSDERVKVYKKDSNGDYIEIDKTELLKNVEAKAASQHHTQKLKEHNEIGHQWVEAKRHAEELDQAIEDNPDSVPLKIAAAEAAIKADKLEQKLNTSQKELAAIKDKTPTAEAAQAEPVKKESTPDVIHTPKGSFVKLSESVKPGDTFRIEKGGRLRTFRVTDEPVKRNANKDLIGRHRIKEVTNAPNFDFTSYNAKKRALEESGFEAQTLEEKVLLHLLGDGRFIRGSEHAPGIEKHIGTRKGSTEAENADREWLAEHGTAESDKAAKADKFAYEFDPNNAQGEGEIGQILSDYTTKSQVLNRLHDIMMQRKAVEEGADHADHTVSFDYTHPETGEVERVEFDGNDPDLDHKLAQYMGMGDGEAPEGFTEEGHPIFNEGLKNEEAISDHKLSETETNELSQILDRATDENGKIDENKLIDEALAILQNRRDEFSPEFIDLLQEISPFAAEKENEASIEKIRNLVSEYEQARNAKGENNEAPERGAGENDVKAIEQGNTGKEGPGDPEAEFNAHAARIKEIDLEVQKQRASQKLEHDRGKEASQKLAAAMKKKATPEEIQTLTDEVNKHKDNWFKKQDRLDKLNAEKAELQRKIDTREREAELKAGYKSVAKNIRAFGEKVIAGGEGMLGSFPLLNPKLAGKLIKHIGDFVEQLGNIHAAIYRGIEKFRTEHPEETLSLEHIQEIKDFVDWMVPPQEKAPVLNIANEEAAKDILADVQSGKMSYTEALAEVMQEGISDKAKGKILNYLDWHLRDQGIHNTETLREPTNESKYIGNYSLTGSGETSRYLSGETLSDVHGQEVQFDVDSKETQLQKNIVQDTANIVGLAKHHSGSNDPLVFGGDMISQLNKIPDGGENSVKKVLAITGLNNELHAERIRIENELQNPVKGEGFEMQDRNELVKRLKDVNIMISQVELRYRDITSNASDVLNAARANRIFRNTYFHDLYADKILSEEQRAAKDKTEEALTKSEVSDDIAEEGALQEKETAEKTVEHIIEDKEKSAAGKDVAKDVTGKTDKRKPSEKGKDKKKGLIDRLKEMGKGKKDKGETKAEGEKRKETITKEQAEKKANEYLGDSTVEDLFQKAKEQTKKPC